MARKGSPTIHKPITQEPPTPYEVTAPGCRHYWLLEPPSGPVSRAICKLCGASREFSNATDDYIHDFASNEEASPAMKAVRS